MWGRLFCGAVFRLDVSKVIACVAFMILKASVLYRF